MFKIRNKTKMHGIIASIQMIKQEKNKTLKDRKNQKYQHLQIIQSFA